MITLSPDSFPIRIGLRQFEVSFTAADDLGMEIGHGDDSEGAINRAFANEEVEVHEFDNLDDLVEFLAYDRWIGKARTRIDGGIDFCYNWHGLDYSERAVFSRLTCENPAVLDALWKIFQKKQYDPAIDAQDWIDTERDRYSPEL